MRISSLRISTRLFLLNIMIFAAFFLVIGVILFSFREAREMLNRGTSHDISGAIARSRTTRHLSQLFSDVEIMSHNFFERNQPAAKGKDLLLKRIQEIQSSAENERLKTAIGHFTAELTDLVDERRIVATLLNRRIKIEQGVLAALNRLERRAIKSAPDRLLKEKKGEFTDRILSIAMAYRKSFLLTENAFHEAVHNHQGAAAQRPMALVLAELDRLEPELTSLLKKAPQGGSAELITRVAVAVRDYREVILSTDQAMALLQIQMNRLDQSKVEILRILRSIDKDAVQTIETVSGKIDEVFFSAGTIMIALSLMVVALLAIGTSYLFHRMINRPMDLLRAGLKSFGAGNSEVRLHLGRRDDWQIVETAFNHMADDLTRSYVALSNSEKKFRELAELLPQPVFELNREGAFTFSNRRVSEIFGYDSDELVNGVHVYQLIDPPRIDRMHQMVRDVLAGKEIEGEEIAALRKDGSLVPVLIYCAPICDQTGSVGIRGTVVDITARKQAEKELAQHRDLLEVLVEKRTVALRQALSELRESEQLYRNLTTQMHDGFIILDESLMLEYVNPRIQELLGYHQSELLNMHISDFHTRKNADVMNEMYYRMRKSNEIVRFETVLPSKQGKEVALMVSSRPEVNNGRIRRVYAICTDITRLKESERALQENQENLEEKIRKRTLELEVARDNAEKANELKNEFLANVSHELRTPMHAILSYSKLGVKKIDIKSKDRIREYFSNIHLSGKRLLVFLNDLLDLSSLQAEKTDYEMQYQDLRRTFREMKAEVLPLLQEKDLYMTIDPKPAVMLTFDNLKIKQVISNLLNNAIKFADSGSDITVEFQEEANGVTVSVKNRGICIPERELQSVFDPFIQSSMTKTGAGGTGLGLTICKKIIEHHGGNIWAEAEDGGATFRFYLPKRNFSIN